MPGQRQGNPQLGFEICPHTCGCVITQSAANRSRRKPAWMKWAPLALKDGHHLAHHIKSPDVHPDCSAFCSRFQSPARDLTHEEWTAWTPHLGHVAQWAQHIPPRYRVLIPATPLEDNYAGPLPLHPLPAQAPTLQHGLASMSIQSTSTGASTSQHPSHPPNSANQSTQSSQHLPGPSTSASGSNTTTSQAVLGPKPLLIFVESPRLTRMDTNLGNVKNLVVYGTYLVPRQNASRFMKPLRTAPKGMAFQEPPQSDDKYPEVISFWVHDSASVLLLNYFV